MNELFEREMRNISINNVSLADYVKENYVPMSVIEDIAEKISDHYIEADNRHLNDLEYGFNQGISIALSVIEDIKEDI